MEEDRTSLSDSDSNDDDYVPGGNEEAVSEEESGKDSDESSNSEEENNGEKTKKRRKLRAGKTRKKIKNSEKICEEKVEEEKTESKEERKQKADALWADFLKDCDQTVKKNVEGGSSNVEIEQYDNKTEASKTLLKQEFEFAGEKVIIEKEVQPSNGTSSASQMSNRGRGRGISRGRGNISSILSQLGKNKKLSTLEKSKLDWDSFKKKEGIEEVLSSHNKGKNGYLERQDFLNRTDLRQFEIEKNLRAATRSSLR